MTDLATKIGAVSKRLEKLERQNRRLRLGLIAAGAIVGAVFLTGALPSTQRTVTASKFILVDSVGRTRADLVSGKDGEPGFFLFDASGKPRAGFNLANGEEPRFVLYDAGGKPRAGFNLAKGEEPRFALYDASGKPGAALALINGGATLLLSDTGDKARTSLTSANGKSEFTLFDGSGKPRADLRLDKGGEPSLYLIDSSGTPRLVLGEAELTSKVQGGTTQTPVSSITAFDKEGNMVRQWP